jgi:hypothetical protein
MLIIHKQDFLYLMIEDDRRDVTDTSIFLTVLLNGKYLIFIGKSIGI